MARARQTAVSIYIFININKYDKKEFINCKTQNNNKLQLWDTGDRTMDNYFNAFSIPTQLLCKAGEVNRNIRVLNPLTH